MKTIIFEAEPIKCHNCGCVFSYEFEDIETEYAFLMGRKRIVRCPHCGNKVDI